jgi:CRP-like cAMP-binding protein
MSAPSPLELQQFRSQLKRFVQFSDEEWEIFAIHLYKKKLKKRAVFMQTGKICNEVGFILSGSFRFYFIRDGVEVSNYFSFQNELISSYPSFIKRSPSTISIDAMENAELVCFSYDSLQTLLKDDRIAFSMEHFGRMIAEYLICCYDERIFSFLSQTPEERYLHLLDTQPEFLQKVPQHYLANYLGITAVSLSRIRKRILEAKAKQKMAS